MAGDHPEASAAGGARSRWLGVAVGLAAVAFVVLVMTSVGGGGSAANTTDGAFLTVMVPHHRSAIDMARLARTRATHRRLRALAARIVSDQSREIEELGGIHRRAFGTPLPAGGHGSLGLSPAQMGMDMDPNALLAAKPFDRTFMDMMIAHHLGAIRMARVELAQGVDKETKGLARAVIRAQSGEISEMNERRRAWFGEPSPAGGVPAAGTCAVAGCAAPDTT